MIWFQILATLFIIFAINRIVNRYRQERVPKSEIIVWLVFWLIVAAAIWWPRGTDIAANWLGISRGYELVVAMSLAVLFYLMFQVFSHLNKLQRQTTELVRQLAIKEHREQSAKQAADDSPEPLLTEPL